MDSEQWKRVRFVLESAMDLPPSERLAYVRQSKIDEEDQRQVEQLLLRADDASALFEKKEWFSQAPMQEPALDGLVLGSFRLLRELGRGGMGAVYLAERADGLYDQRVAIKLMQAAVMSPRLIERFQQERQILARLKHPGIARLLDGGVTPDERPYLVLEFIDGVPIDRYCEDAGLNLEERVQLFLKVADAVQSAHQQFVLHLDLKPANILVDERGEPRLLDFGIAQLLGGSDGSALAQENTSRLMTPRYASPEQIAGQPVAVTSDVFSLATLLYRLLTGTLPYAFDGATPLEIARVIKEKPPALPSEAAPSELWSSLRGDLDTILLQALRKEPERRYQTVNAFAQDLQRHLDSEPVLAHPDSLTYRASKFFRRNRTLVAISSVAAAILIASVVAVVHSAIVARRQREVAEKRLSDVRDLAHSYVFDLDSMLEQVPGTIHIRNFVLQKAQKYLEASTKEPGSDEFMQDEIAEGYLQIGRVQALPGLPSMSDWRAAASSQAKGVEIERRILARHPNDPAVQNELLRHLINEAQVYETVGNLGKVQKIFDEQWQIAQPLIARGPKGIGFSRTAIVPWNIAVLHCGNEDDWNLADPAGSLPWLQKTDELAHQYLQENPQGKYAELSKAMLERVAINRAYLAEHSEDPRTARVFYDQAMALTSGSDLVEQETRKQLRGLYADYLLVLGDAKGAYDIAPRPDENLAIHERGKDRMLSADEADELQLLGRIDMSLGRVAEGRRKVEAGLRAYDTLFSTLPEDAQLSASVAHAHFDYAEEPSAPTAVRYEQYNTAIRIAEKIEKESPLALSASLFLGRCHIGLAKMAASRNDLSAEHDAAQLAVKYLTRVLIVHPDNAEAARVLRVATKLAS